MVTKGVRGERVPAERLPVARICVDVPLAHLDRPFDYLVSTDDDEAAQPGVRVKVRFAGQLISGFLLERAESSPHAGKLAYLDKVVSPERVLHPEVARLARAVADRYAGNLCDVLRLAVPPRHARVEAQAVEDAASAPTPGEIDRCEPAGGVPAPGGQDPAQGPDPAPGQEAGDETTPAGTTGPVPRPAAGGGASADGAVPAGGGGGGGRPQWVGGLFIRNRLSACA